MSGLLLVLLGAVSHLPRMATSAISGRQKPDTSEGVVRRIVMIVIGLGAAGYALTRIVG